MAGRGVTNFAGKVRIDNSTTHAEGKLYASSHKTLTSGSDNGYYGVSKIEAKQTYANILMNIDRDFNSGISLHTNIGASYSDMKYDRLNVNGPIQNDGLPNVFTVSQLDDLTTIRDQTGWHDQIQSVFASAELGYRDAYFLTLTGRNDWASQLAGLHSNAKSFFYPSIGASFVLSEIFSLPEQIEYAKLRASFASVGTPFERFFANPTYGFAGSNNAWETQSSYPMYDLKPETTESFEVGLSTRFLKYFNIDFTYYKARTFNQTFNPHISVSAGYSSLYIQTGNVQNEGIELALGCEIGLTDFKWTSNFTLSKNKNKIIKLVDNFYHAETGKAISKDELDVGGLNSARFILKEGGTLGDLYSTVDLVRDSEGDIFINEEGNVMIDKTVDKILLGSVLPKANLGWRNDFRYKNFNLGFLISARLGGVVYSETQAILDRYGVSKASADARDNGGVIINGSDVVNAQKWYETVGKVVPQYYTYSATNVRLQEASIGYNIPKKIFFNAANVTLSIVGRNLFMFYCKAPFDPETVATTGNYYQGLDKFMMPSLSSIGFNARIKF
ncbi:MAG: TonB-dependent receptor [Cytophagales bacterium]|nr:TonB-dependent receptor [Cytophagales bacterium]